MALPRTLLILAPLLPSCGDSGPVSVKQRPNVLLVVIDTLRADRLGCYGYDGGTSPNLDAYAQGCFVFENAQSVAPWTAPSLISLMTSLRPDAHAVEVHRDIPRLPERVDTLAELCSRAGYATAAFTEGGYAKGAFGLDQGFDLYPTYEGDERSYTSNQASPSRLVENLDRLLAWLEERPDDQPFLALFQTYEVHSPFRAPEAEIQRYAPGFDEAAEHAAVAAAIEGWNGGRAPDDRELRLLQRHLLHCGLQGMSRLQNTAGLLVLAEERGLDLRRPQMAGDPAVVSWLSCIYDAEIAYTDRQLQRLWEALEANGQAGETIVVIVSDHGEGLGDHGDLGHGRGLFEEQLRVPLLLRVPGSDVEPGRVGGVVRTVDVMPTLLELLDLAPGATPLQGHSLVPVLHGEAAPSAPAFAHVEAWGAHAHMVREGDWRLIEDHTTGTVRLHDLAVDPGELFERGTDEPAVVERLRGLLAEQRARDATLRAELGAGDRAAEIDPSTRRDLEFLGYAGDE